MRDSVVNTLCEKFAADVLPVEEFEARIDQALSAVTIKELEAVLVDLPDHEPPQAKEPLGAVLESVAQVLDRAGLSELLSDGDGPFSRPSTNQSVTGSTPDTVLTPGQGTSVSPSHATDRPPVTDHHGALQDNVIAVFGGTVRRGRWRPARRTRAVAVFGGADIDLREAELPPGVTEIFVVAAWGGVDIIVPPDLQVEIGGMAIFGGFDQRVDGSSIPMAGPQAPILHIKGVAFMGGVDVTARYPGESEREAKRRRKLERKRRRRLR